MDEYIQKTYRFYSVMWNLGWVAVGILGCLALALVLSCLGPLAAIPGLGLLLLMVIGLPGAVLVGLIWPHRAAEQPPAGRRKFAWGFGAVGLLFCAVLAWVAFGVVSLSVNGRPVRGTYETFGELQKQRIVNALPVVNQMIPPAATNIHFIGSGGLALLPLGRTCIFSCNVAEPDFRAFAAEHEYPLATNILRNVNVEINDDIHPAEMSVDQVGGCLFETCADRPDTEIKNYLSYWYGYSNFGGVILVYDLDTHVLYGSYSSN